MNTRSPCLVTNSSNVYRTKTFIVRQEISLGSDSNAQMTESEDFPKIYKIQENAVIILLFAPLTIDIN